MSQQLSIPFWAIWKNPIFRRYCRSGLRLRKLGIWALIVVLVAGYSIVASMAVGVRQVGVSSTEALRIAFIPIFFLQMFIMFALAMANVSGGITREGDEGVSDYQRLMPLRPLTKVIGYLFGLPIKEYLLFAVTVPFSAYVIIMGDVSYKVWVPLYVAFICSAVLYHLTGLLTGTVIKNRRWAFLASMTIVFCLYTIVPEISKLGINVFRYLTIRPVLEESWYYFIPDNASMAVQAITSLAPNAGFFGMKLPSFLFILFSQGGLIVFFLMMLCRHWERREQALLSKGWAVVFFGWIQIMLLGNALPAIPGGEIFPSVAFGRFAVGRDIFDPSWEEAAAILGIYGTVVFILMIIFINIITPTQKKQMEGWRRASKLGLQKLPLSEEGRTAAFATMFIALSGAVSWFLFMKFLIESVWFPGHYASMIQLGIQCMIMLILGLTIQSFMELHGRMPLLVVAIFSGVVPIMSGVISGILEAKTLGIWLSGMSPLLIPYFFSYAEIGLGVIDVTSSQRAIPYVYKFALFLYSLAAVFCIYRLIQMRQALKSKILSE